MMSPKEIFLILESRLSRDKDKSYDYLVTLPIFYNICLLHCLNRVLQFNLYFYGHVTVFVPSCHCSVAGSKIAFPKSREVYSTS